MQSQPVMRRGRSYVGLAAMGLGIALGGCATGDVTPIEEEAASVASDALLRCGEPELEVWKTLTLPNLFGFPEYEHLRVPIYRSRGRRGPGILLIHGNSSSSRSYVNQLFSTLGATQRIYAIDLPGYGAADHVTASRPLPVNAAGIPQGFPEYQVGLVEAIAIAAADPEIDPQIFVGWSLGGDVLLLAQGLGLLPHARGLMIFGTAPAGAAPPTTEAPFLAPDVPGLPGLGVLPSFGFAFEFSSSSPLGFDLTASFDDAVPAYAPSPISLAPTIGDAYVRAFFRPAVRLSGNVPEAFLDDAFVRTDPRTRSSIGAVALGLLPPGGLPDELDVLRGLDGDPLNPHDDVDIAVLVGRQDAFANAAYLDDLADAGDIPTLWRHRIVRVPGAGHAAHYERPVEFNALLAAFSYDATH